MTEEKVNPKGETWGEMRERLLTPERRAASHARVAEIGKKIDARNHRRAVLRQIITRVLYGKNKIIKDSQGQRP